VDDSNNKKQEAWRYLSHWFPELCLAFRGEEENIKQDSGSLKGKGDIVEPCKKAKNNCGTTLNNSTLTPNYL